MNEEFEFSMEYFTEEGKNRLKPIVLPYRVVTKRKKKDNKTRVSYPEFVVIWRLYLDGTAVPTKGTPKKFAKGLKADLDAIDGLADLFEDTHIDEGDDNDDDDE